VLRVPHAILILDAESSGMPKKVVTHTGVPGATAEDRKMLSGITGTLPAPTLKSDGVLTNRNEFIHFLFKVAGVSPVFSVQVWWYSFISGEWHRGEKLTVNNSDVVSIEVQGLNRVALEVTQIAGTAPVLDAWLALVVPV
jgi:hypothetical protein